MKIIMTHANLAILDEDGTEFSSLKVSKVSDEKFKIEIKTSTEIQVGTWLI